MSLRGNSGEVKRLEIAELRRQGYLQELNRRFLHPLGLALEVVVEEDGSERLGGVWDCRDEPEGISYGGEIDLAPHARRVDELLAVRADARAAALGYVVQPAGDTSGRLPLVTVIDPTTGEIETAEIPPDQYILLVGQYREVDGVQLYGNGTVVLTIKRKTAS